VVSERTKIEAIRAFNSDMRTSFTSVSMTMISGFVGMKAASLPDSPSLALTIPMLIMFIALVYKILISYHKFELMPIVALVVVSTCAIKLIEFVVGNFWMAFGLIVGWTLPSVLFQLSTRNLENDD